jgi:hypothetical protein
MIQIKGNTLALMHRLKSLGAGGSAARGPKVVGSNPPPLPRLSREAKVLPLFISAHLDVAD